MELFYEEQIIKLEDIYEIAIKRFLHSKEVRKAIPLIRTLIIIRGENENYSAVFCYLILNIIISQINTETHKRDLTKIAFYTYKKPLELLEIIEGRLNAVFDIEEEGAYFREKLEKVRLENHCYALDNLLLDEDIINKVKENEERYRLPF